MFFCNFILNQLHSLAFFPILFFWYTFFDSNDYSHSLEFKFPVFMAFIKVF